MPRRIIIMSLVTILVILLWVAVLVIGDALSTVANDSTQADAAPTLTATPRQPRDDVPELRADNPTATLTPTLTAVPPTATEAQPTRTLVASPTITYTPSPAFTLNPVAIDPLAAPERLETLEPNQSAQSTTLGTYPIQLAIPDLGINEEVVVVHLDRNLDIVTPRDEVGYYLTTPRLGAGGNSVMVGHVARGRVFNNLLDVQLGQVVRVTDDEFIDHYFQVQEIVRIPYEIGTEEDRELGYRYIYDNTQERLTLVTCYPEDEWTHRFVVRAVPISPPG